MKKIALFSIAALPFTLSYAQPTFSVHAGTQISKWRGNGSGLLDTLVEKAGDYLKQGSYTSFYVGVNGNFPIGAHFAIEPGLQYSQVGTSLASNFVFKILKNYGINLGAKAITHRIEMPVLLKGEIAKGLWLVAGPQVNYSYNNKLQLKAGIFGFNVINKKIDIDNGFESFSAAALGGLQYQFPVGIRVQALYEYGVTKIINNNNANVYQNNIKLGMSIPLTYRHKEDEWD